MQYLDDLLIGFALSGAIGLLAYRRGALDTSGVANRRRGRSKYGSKRAKEKAEVT